MEYDKNKKYKMFVSETLMVNTAKTLLEFLGIDNIEVCKSEMLPIDNNIGVILEDIVVKQPFEYTIKPFDAIESNHNRFSPFMDYFKFKF